jgi:hypothetical protein
MRKILILILLACSLISQATVWHVATTGNDGTGDGSSGTPWLTIAHAISEASSGDSIYVTAGTYNVTAQMDVPTGISIYSTGTKPVIASSSAIQAIFLLSSATEGTNGNQSISGIRFTGGDAVDYGVLIIARSNVLIHDCEFDGMEYYAIKADGSTSNGRPVTWATGNRFYSNTVADCGHDVLSGGTLWLVYGGGIEITGQSGPSIHDNDIINGEGFGGGIRSIGDSGFVRGIAIYDNDISVYFRDVTGQTSYAFAIELWTGKGGNRIYRNNLNGGIDLGGYGWDDSGGYGFAFDVSDNVVILPAMPTNTEEAGLLFESGVTGGAYWRRNFVKNFSKGITFSLTQNSLVQGINGYYVESNIFSEIGRVSGSMTGTTMEFNVVPSTGFAIPAINDFRFANNIMHRAGSPVQTYGLNCVATNAATGIGATWTNIVAVNNISYNVYTPLKWEDQVVDTAQVWTNIFYNATNNARFVNGSLANDTVQTALTDNPVFKSLTDFHLQSTSPAINAGTNAGITSDFHGASLYGAAYDIGAFEYGVNRMINIGTTIPTINYKIVLIDH